MNVEPFTVAVPDSVLVDLRQRLGQTRWPDEIAGAGWSYGVPLHYMRELVAYWRHDFDWRAQERVINGFTNFRAEIDGLGIHFVVERGKGSKPLPLLLLHGWPSTFYEMLPLAQLLADPERRGGDPRDAFDVVVPSIPGHGFSDRPRRPGFEDRQAAEICQNLMRGLGYERFAIHAYDLGASIAGLLCLDHPDRVIGYHTTSPGNPSPYLGPAPPLTDAERAYRAYMEQWANDEYAYARIQGTRPQTLAYGLNDSPAVLAAWIVDKWWAWTVPADGGELEAYFSKNELLTNVMIYWITETINSANRYYFEGRHTRWPGSDDRIPVPTGVALTTQRFERPPREYVARLHTDIRSWTELGRGGHFVAGEEPELVAESIRTFFHDLRQGGGE